VSGRFIVAVLALVTFSVVACGPTAAPTPTPTSQPTVTPVPTPNIEATVESRLQATLTAIPTPTATPTPAPTSTPPPQLTRPEVQSALVNHLLKEIAKIRIEEDREEIAAVVGGFLPTAIYEGKGKWVLSGQGRKLNPDGSSEWSEGRWMLQETGLVITPINSEAVTLLDYLDIWQQVLPTPILIATPTLRPTMSPTPRPTPSPTPEVWSTYRNPRHGYTIIIPTSSNVRDENPDIVHVFDRNLLGQFWVAWYGNDKYGTLSLDQVADSLIEAIRKSLVVIRGGSLQRSWISIDGRSALQISYIDDFVHLGCSMHRVMTVTYSRAGQLFSINSQACEEDLNQIEGQFQAMQNSFTALAPRAAAIPTPSPSTPIPTLVPVISSCSPAIESQIDGEFEGWDGDSVFQLTNGQIWQQDEYDYTYHYSYRPQVTIFSVRSGCEMHVDGLGDTIRVRQLVPMFSGCSPAIESRIDGQFDGWEGDTIFQLANGQIWQQTQYAYKYRYKYRPTVTIFSASGGCTMQVDGVDRTIRVQRIG